VHPAQVCAQRWRGIESQHIRAAQTLAYPLNKWCSMFDQFAKKHAGSEQRFGIQ